MIFYRDEDGHWYATQADAKASKKQWFQEEVPTDKYGLLAWLNHQVALAQEQIEPEPTPTITSSPDPQPPVFLELPKPQYDANSIVNWLLDEATQGQVEAVFSAIGCRWGEARNQ